MGFHSLVNTAYFSLAARDFTKNGGQYTLAPHGSREWIEFWDEERRKCIEGYSVGGTRITGRHYHYLNYAPISKVPDEVFLTAYNERKKGNRISSATAEKIFSFPRFYEISYEWYWFKHIAWYGGTFMGIHSPGGKHLVAGKTRGAGFSYMEAQDGVYNYTFIPGSKNYYFAGIEAFLNEDGILNKAVPMMDWLNAHVDVWKQNRHKVNSMKDMNFRASYVDDQGVEKGSFSEITGVVVDKPDKVRGKRGRKITFEEGGSFKNLLRAIAIALGTIKDGSMYTGQMSIFGTGGEDGPGIEGLEEVFYNPEIYDCLTFPNIFEPGMEDTTCGYFVPVFRTDPLFMDENGNVDEEGAIAKQVEERKKKARSKKPKALDMYKAEYPFSPAEAFNRLKFSPFLADACRKRVKLIETSAAIQSLIRYGYMDYADGKPTFIVQSKEKAKPILEYPHNQKDDLSGCATIFEPPFTDIKDKVPPGIYTVVFDPYALDNAEDMTSLFVAYVLKNWNNTSLTSQGLPVASYIARPEDLDTCYEQLFILAEYYNAKVQGERPGGGQGVINYARANKKLHLLEKEPEIILHKEYKSGFKNEGFLMNMPPEKKLLGLKYLVDWHKSPRAVMEANKVLRTIDYINDVGLLQEFIKFDGKRNADRISAMITGMYMLKENVLRQVQEDSTESTDNFYNRELYAANNVEDSEILTPY